MPSLRPLQILSIDIRLPGLGTKEKNAKRMRKSQDVPLSYSAMNESNDSYMYTYQPIDTEAKEIRLMTLLSGSDEDAIRIELRTTTLPSRKGVTPDEDGDRFPIYEALSYAWGPKENPASITVLEDEIEHTLAVTQNLAGALQHLRYDDRPRTFWIDAICVDQENLEERGLQVRRMPDIYTSADRVVIWIGPEGDGSDVAIQTLDHLGSRVDCDWGTGGFFLRSGEIPYDGWEDHNIRLPFDLNVCDSLILLFRRSWFGRLWVWQEIRLANERSIVCCGRRSILWQHLRVARIFLAWRFQPLGSRLSLGTRALRLCTYAKRTEPLQYILYDSIEYECSDDKDKIYAILGICEDQLNIIPDYRKSTAQVYEETFLAYYASTGRLDLLSNCRRDHDLRGMPSWVPNWAVRKPLRKIPQYSSASGCSKAYADSGVNGVLTALGTRAGVVRNSESLRPRSQMTKDWVALIRRMAMQQADSTSRNTRRENIDDVCATLCCNVFSDNSQPHQLIDPNVETSKHFLNCLVESNADPELSSQMTADVKNYIDAVSRYTTNRSFIVTGDNRIGIASEETSIGDEIVVILGCLTPMLLRPTAQGYLVVGECYLHGYMQAESLLGPLPHPWQCVSRYSKELGYFCEFFFNKETNQYRLDDPRLGPLPNGWQVSSHRREAWWNQYVNEITGEDAGIYDPRLSPEALKQRGVQLQKFRLI